MCWSGHKQLVNILKNFLIYQLNKFQVRTHAINLNILTVF